jgi:hypothetical protein
MEFDSNPLVQALAQVLPGKPGEAVWRQAVLDIARVLQASGHRRLADPRVTDLVIDWFRRLDEPGCKCAAVFEELGRCWSLVRNIDGRNWLSIAQGDGNDQDTDPLPDAAQRFGDDPLYVRLIHGLRNLSRYNRGKPFPVSCRQAAQLLGLSSHQRGNDMLNALASAGIIEMVQEASLTNLPGKDCRAARLWRFIEGSTVSSEEHSHVHETTA